MFQVGQMLGTGQVRSRQTEIKGSRVYSGAVSTGRRSQVMSGQGHRVSSGAASVEHWPMVRSREPCRGHRSGQVKAHGSGSGSGGEVDRWRG